MRAVIFVGGSISDYGYVSSFLKRDDLIIAADSGLDHLAKLNIVPDIFIGDMDSVKSAIVAGEVIRLEEMKDETDSEAAAMLACERGAKEILLLGATGTRIDHMLANLLLLRKMYKRGVNVVVADEHNEIYYLKNEIELCGTVGEIVSIIPIEELVGVTTDGLLYVLSDGTLEFGASRGVSNVMTDTVCRITAKSGEALVIKSKD